MDAKAGIPPFIFDLIFHPENRKRNLKKALHRLIVPIIVGTVLDAIAQYLIFRNAPDRTLIIRPLAALLIGTFVIGAPYSLARGITNRIISRKQKVKNKDEKGAQQ